MNDELRRKAVVRKAIYFGIILALFTLSMFWRGVFTLPIGDLDRALKLDENNNPVPLRAVDVVARLPIRYQADDLELRELDMGDPEIAGAAAQVSLIGFRGAVVTLLWRAAIKKQVRGEYQEMEFYSRLVSRLQPHFIEPWIFQAWNISYNVSVETDKLGDQYYYIAKGISFLSEGERINTRTHRRGGAAYRIGSPDIRFQIGFYYQNKFTVADKVETLRCLAQLSNIPPGDRDPKKLTVDGTVKGRVDPDRFLKFCENNPQLVRRMKKAVVNPLNNKIEGLNLKTPEEVVDFLAVNQLIPARYLPTGELAPEESQFPVFPKNDPQNDPGLNTFMQRVLTRPHDTIDMLHAARAWFSYAQEVVPPPSRPGEDGVPMAVPRKGEYDEFRYRIPLRPALIEFRKSPCRSQTYLAERLQKEGWIDRTSVWSPDEATDNKWFPQTTTPVRLKAGLSSVEEWLEAYNMFKEYGQRNGMDPKHRLIQEEIARPSEILGPLGQQLMREYSDEELKQMGIPKEALDARTAIMHYDQNRHITNYQYFLDSCLLETDPRISTSRQLLWDAKTAHATGDEAREIEIRVKAAAEWRSAISDAKFQSFYQSERTDQMHELTNEQEMTLATLLKTTSAVNQRIEPTKVAVAIAGSATSSTMSGTLLTQLISLDEAKARIAMATPSADLNQRVAELMKAAASAPGVKADPEITRRGLINTEFSWMKDSMERGFISPWVRESIRKTYLRDKGYIARQDEAPSGPGSEPPSGTPPGGAGR